MSQRLLRIPGRRREPATLADIRARAAALAAQLKVSLTDAGDDWQLHCARTGVFLGTYAPRLRRLRLLRLAGGAGPQRVPDWSVAIRTAAAWR